VDLSRRCTWWRPFQSSRLTRPRWCGPLGHCSAETPLWPTTDGQQSTQIMNCRPTIGKERKGKQKEAYLYSAFYILCISQSAQAWITQLYLQIHHACLSFVSVHQMAPPLTEVRDIQLQLTTHLSTPRGWKAELAWLVDLQWTVYPHKWSPVSYRSSAGQGKFAGQSPTFYDCATQPTRLLHDAST